MRKFTPVLAVLVMIVLGLNSCIFDPKKEPDFNDPGKPLETFEDLTVRDHVLNNLKLAYNQSNINQYDRLLDDAFIFHFSAADVRDGTVTVEQWDRALEVGATTNMFDKNFSPPSGAPISDISLTMTYPIGDESWTAIVDPDPVNFPGETWYEKTVDYLLTVQAGETTYTSGNPIGASFVVRLAEVNGKQIWRIVIWRDDI